MATFQRSIHSSVQHLDENRLLAAGALWDPEHPGHGVRVSTADLEADDETIGTAPLAHRPEGNLPIRRMCGSTETSPKRRAGGWTACAALVELTADAARLVLRIRIGDSVGDWAEMPSFAGEETMIAETKDKLRNSLCAFAEE